MEKRYETRSGDLFVRSWARVRRVSLDRRSSAGETDGVWSSGQGELMPFVDPGRIEQSDRVQAASFASESLVLSFIQIRDRENR